MRIPLLIVLLLTLAPTWAAKEGQTTVNIVGRDVASEKFYRFVPGANTRPTVINFFASDCTPCREELPELAKLERQYPKVDFIAISVSDDDWEQVRDFVNSLSDHPKTMIQGSKMIHQRVGFMANPYTIVVDTDGIVRYTHHGYNSPASLNGLKHYLRTH